MASNLQQQSLKTLTNSVSEQMQYKLYQNGQYSQCYTLGIDQKSTALAMGIARLYSGGPDGKFSPMKLGGILCLVVDRRVHSRFLRLYDINTSQLLFQSELYFNFHNNYRELSDYFHCFPLEKIIVGIQFANVHDASAFKNLIIAYSFKGDNVEELVKEQQAKLGNPNYEISKPISFERKEHAGWDPSSQTFILNEIPKEIKALLKRAGFKKKDLKTKETALAIYEILLREIEIDSINAKQLTAQQLGGRTSSNLNQKDFIQNRISNRPLTSNEDSRIDNRSYSLNNFGNFQSQNTLAMQNPTSPDILMEQNQKNKQMMTHLGSYMANQVRTTTMKNDSPQHPGMAHQEEQKQSNIPKAPPIPPPLMGMIPPPPMGIPPPNVGGGMMLPPPPGGKLVPPPAPPMVGNKPSGLSFTEELALQSQNLKKVQTENQINNKVKNLSESQQMKITMNLAVVLEQRKKALMNDDNNKNNSYLESEEEDNDSDGSAW